MLANFGSGTLAVNADQTLVLTYHSISAAPGPTSTPAETFCMQMDQLAEAGYASMTLQDFTDWRGGRLPAGRRVLITFDDAFLDYPETAHPILRGHGFSSVMFAPTGKLGGTEAWLGADVPARPLMSWEQVKSLAEDGVEFGSHSVNHADLTAIPDEARRFEIEESGAELERRLGRPTRSFAAPYGHVNRQVLADLAGRYELAFGTRLDRPHPDDDPLDVSRVEMHYFREQGRWRDFLEGGQAYFQTRRLLRQVREAAARLRGRSAAYG
jgi:peptidoglycan/xylan/chitin deacetylase (PgdA/CDA1 family)